MKEQLEAAEKIYGATYDWYKSAESKAQIVLTVLSSFIAFSTGIILANPDNFRKTVAIFDTLIYLALFLALMSILYGLYAAFMCLRSRLDTPTPPGEPEAITYPVNEMYFFGHHAYHRPEVLFYSLKNLTVEKQIEMLSYQIIALSRNVVAKHRYVNRGFLAVCVSVFALLLVIIFYLRNLTAFEA